MFSRKLLLTRTSLLCWYEVFPTLNGTSQQHHLSNIKYKQRNTTNMFLNQFPKSEIKY